MVFDLIFSTCCVLILSAYIGMWRKYNFLYDSYKDLDFKYHDLKSMFDKFKSIFFDKGV